MEINFRALEICKNCKNQFNLCDISGLIYMINRQLKTDTIITKCPKFEEKAEEQNNESI